LARATKFRNWGDEGCRNALVGRPWPEVLAETVLGGVVNGEVAWTAGACSDAVAGPIYPLS